MKPQKIGSMVVHKITETPEFRSPWRFGFDEAAWAYAQQAREWLGEQHLGRLLGPDLDSSEFALSVHSFVIQSGGRNILVDTCCGNGKQRADIPFAHMRDTDYIAQLAAIGLSPADIDVVLCTHLHFDHIGWNTRLEDGAWVPTFPNARYHFSRLDYEHFLAQPADDPIHGVPFHDSVLPIVRARQAVIVEAGHQVELDLDHDIWLELEGAPGHTPGNCVVHARRGGGHALFTGDVMHHPIQIGDPTIGLPVDMDPDRARAARTRLVSHYADTDTVLFPAHFLDPTCGRILSEKDGYRYRFLDM